MESAPKPTILSDIFDPKKFNVEVESLESASELESRLRRQEEDAAYERAQKKAVSDHERRKDLILFVASLLIVGLSTLCCLVALFLSPSNSQWAAPLLTLIVGGLLGYQTGKSSTSKLG